MADRGFGTIFDATAGGDFVDPEPFADNVATTLSGFIRTGGTDRLLLGVSGGDPLGSI